MKTKNILVLIGSIAYSYLFYEESAGINFLLINLLLIIGSIVLDSKLIQEKAFLAISLGCIISSTMIMVYSYQLGIIANIISLSLLAHYHIFPNSSILIALGNIFYSLLASFKRENNEKVSIRSKWLTGTNFFIVLISIIITGVFLMIYSSSNPIFSEWIGKINFDFISFGWIFFTLLGCYLIFIFFNHKALKELIEFDKNMQDQLNRIREKGKHFTVGLRNEFRAGILLLGLLNFLLVFLNLSDLQYFITKELPEESNYTHFLHQGVFSLIISIILAIIIILFFFRKNLNFFSKIKSLRILTFAWLFQNFLLVISICGKNTIYIQDSGLLTYKRIGVYVYLLLTCIGLILTFIKVLNIKSNWFLIRKVSWAFYTVLILSTFVDWDKVICNYNLQQNKIEYLLMLTPNTYSSLKENKKLLTEQQQLVLEGKIDEHTTDFEEKTWCSWNLTYNIK